MPQFVHPREVDEDRLGFLQPALAFAALGGDRDRMSLVQDQRFGQQQEQDECRGQQIEQAADIPPDIGRGQPL